MAAEAPASRWRRALPRGRFARRLATLAGGTLASQAIFVAASPLLTRLYSPADIGVFLALTAVISILAPLAALRLEAALLTVADEAEAHGLHRLARRCALAAAALVGLALLAWAGAAGSTGGPPDASWLAALPLGVLLYGLNQASAATAMRAGHDRANGASLAGQSLCQAALQCGLGWLGFGAAGLAAGYVAGLAFRQAWLALALARRPPPVPAQPRRRLLGLLVAHRRWPLVAAPSALLRLSAQFLPVLLVAALYGPAVAGLFGLGHRLLAMPIRVVGLAASQVFLTEAGANPERLERLFVRTLTRFAALGLAWALPLALLAPWLFAAVFGEEWRQAGVFVQLLLPYHLARFVAVPVSQTLNLLGRHGTDLALSALILASVLGPFALAAAVGLGPAPTLALYAALAAAAFLSTLPVGWHWLRRRPPAAIEDTTPRGDA